MCPSAVRGDPPLGGEPERGPRGMGCATASVQSQQQERGPMNTAVTQAIGRIDGLRHRINRRRALLVAMSGIDASGKGHLSREVTQGLQERGCQVALINVD